MECLHMPLPLVFPVLCRFPLEVMTSKPTAETFEIVYFLIRVAHVFRGALPSRHSHYPGIFGQADCFQVNAQLPNGAL